MPDCASCKHWDKAPKPPTAPTLEKVGDRDGVPVFRQVGRGPLPGEWGTCERIIRYGDNSYSPAPDLDEWTDDPVYLSDGSGYFASLTSRADFGCVLHETRPDA